MIEDKLSEYLDINTFRFISSSHNVETQIDLNTQIATFTFNDIYLPDSFVNAVGSQGFVKYQILGNENLAENSIIENTASIFFDANPPIITNTTSNQMVSQLPLFPVLAASPNTINFGEIDLNEATNLTHLLLIENLGDLPLHIEQLNFENPVFSSDEIQDLTIQGQGSVEVPIYFEPTEGGNYQSELVLQSTIGELSIALNGTAIIETAINNSQQGDFMIFPNPSEGIFYLQSMSTNENVLFYWVQNSLGDLLLKGKNSSNSTQIDLSQQPKGIYFLCVQTKEGTFIKKIITH